MRRLFHRADAKIAKVRKDSTGVAAIAVGDKLICSTSAAVTPATGDASSAQFVIGRALEAMASGTTCVITCHLTFEGGGSTCVKGAA